MRIRSCLPRASRLTEALITGPCHRVGKGEVTYGQKSPASADFNCRRDHVVSRACIKELRLKRESGILQNPKTQRYISASEGAQLFPQRDKYDGGQVERGVAGKGKYFRRQQEIGQRNPIIFSGPNRSSKLLHEAPLRPRLRIGYRW